MFLLSRNMEEQRHRKLFRDRDASRGMVIRDQQAKDRTFSSGIRILLSFCYSKFSPAWKKLAREEIEKPFRTRTKIWMEINRRLFDQLLKKDGKNIGLL